MEVDEKTVVGLSPKRNQEPATITPISESPPEPEDYVRPEPVTDDLQGDLLDFAFSDEKVAEMLKQPQSMWDPWKRDGCKEWNMQQARLAKEKGEAARKRRKEIDAYEPLFLKQGSDWALYDPGFHEYPLSPGRKAPAMFTNYEKFKPGSARVVEINVNTFNVRITSTPSILHNKHINYEKTGPKVVVDDSAVEVPSTVNLPPKRRPGRPRKTVAPAFTSVTGRAKRPVKARTFTFVDMAAKRTSPRSIEKTIEKVPAVEAPTLRKTVIKSEPNVDDTESDLTDIE